MDALLKPFAALATNWKSDQFFKARLKLSLLYLLIVFVILGGVSIIFYISAKRQIENFPRRFVIQAQIVPGRLPVFEMSQSQQVIVDDIEDQLISNLLTVDLSILVIVFLLGYWWAGKTLRPIKETIEQQKRFIADASHELRTPLAVMKTSLDVFERQEKHIAAQTKELLGTIREEVNHLSGMTTQLLDLSMADLSVASSELVELSALLRAVHKRFSSIAIDKKITLTVQDVPEIFIRGNKNALEHAFSNIIDNAIKYTPAEGTVTVGLEVKDKDVVIKVTDTGVGIASKDIAHIFNRFYQGDASKHGAGVGLGLSIVKSIVEKHDGAIDVQSTPEKGSEFSISMPKIPS